MSELAFCCGPAHHDESAYNGCARVACSFVGHFPRFLISLFRSRVILVHHGGWSFFSFPISVCSQMFRHCLIFPATLMSHSLTRSLWPSTPARGLRSVIMSHLSHIHRTQSLASFQQQMAQQVLTRFEENPDSWTKVPSILENSNFPQAKVRRNSHLTPRSFASYGRSSTLAFKF